MHGHQNPLLTKVTLALLLMVSATSGQHLWIESASTDAPALGDTIDVTIHVDTQDRLLTSIGLALFYDPRRLRALDGDADEGTEPFAIDLALSVGTYTNDVVQASISDARARLVVVTAQQSGNRDVIAGQHLLARARWQVIGAASTTGISLVPAGPDGPVFTEQGHPGRQNRFALTGQPVSLHVSAEGYVPLADLHLNSQQRWTWALDRIHPSQALTWRLDHQADHLAQLEIVDGHLQIRARPRTAGSAPVAYVATDEHGEIVRGVFNLTVAPAEPSLALKPVVMSEDVAVHLPNPVLPHVSADTYLLVQVGTGLLVSREGADWHLSSEPDWAGVSSLTLRLFDEHSVLVDSLVVPVAVQAIDDAPQLQTDVVEVLVAMEGVDSWGPELSDLLRDVDDAVTSFHVTVEGDSLVAVEIVNSRLRFHGLASGLGAVRLQAIDARGVSWQWTLPVQVTGQSQGPQFQPWKTPVLHVDMPTFWSWGQLLTDGGVVEGLQMAAQSSANVQVQVEADGLRVEATQEGEGWIRLLATDEQGNSSSTVLSVQVDVPGADDPGAGDPAVEGPDVEDPASAPMEDLVDEAVIEVGQTPQGEQDPIDDLLSDVPGDESDDQTGDGGTQTVGPGENPTNSQIDLSSIEITLPERLGLMAGSALELRLDDYLSGVQMEDVLWVADDGLLVKTRVEDGRLFLEAPIQSAGTDQISVHLYVEQRRMTITIDVELEAPVAQLHIRDIPPVRLTQGGSIKVDLSGFAVDAVGPVQWQIGAASLVTARIEGDVLQIEAGQGRVGEEALRLTVIDDSGDAERLLRVIVETDASMPLQVEVPDEITMGSGEFAEFDLASWVVAGDVSLWRVLALPEGVTAVLDDGFIHLTVAASVPAGMFDVQLEAVTQTQTIGLAVQIHVVEPPTLVLSTPSAQHVHAGRQQALLDLGTLVLQADGPVRWELVDAGHLGASLEQQILIVDARASLPGRQVVRLRAITAARVQDVDLIVRIDPPSIQVTAWQVELAAGIAARLSLDELTSQDPSAEDSEITWFVAAADTGIHAVWDGLDQRLTVVADLPGELLLEARLASGLQVASSRLGIALLGITSNDVPDPLEHASADPLPSDGVIWGLTVPSVDSHWSGQTMTLSLFDLVHFTGGAEGLDTTWVQSMAWEARLLGGGEGDVWIEAGEVQIQPLTTSTLWIRATDPDGQVQSIVIPLAIRPIPDPTIHVEVSDSGLDLFVEAADPARVSVTVDALPVVLIDGHVQLRLEQGIHHSLVAVSVSIEDVQKVVQQSIVSLIGGSDGGRFDLPDAGARVEIPVGSGGGLLMQRVEEGVELLLSPRLAADGVGLFLTHTAEGSNRIAAGRTGRSEVVPGARSSGVSGLEWLSPDGWVTVPSWQVSNPPGVYGTVFDSGVYRLAETQGEASALTPVHAFPNPFNAQVTLQFAPTFPGLVELIVYDPLGQPVRQWRFDHPGGVGSLIWDGSDRGGRPVASGMYLLQVKTPGGTHMHKLLLLR